MFAHYHAQVQSLEKGSSRSEHYSEGMYCFDRGTARFRTLCPFLRIHASHGPSASALAIAPSST